MFDIIFRFDPDRPVLREPPADPDEARRRLEQGNREFASILGRQLRPEPGKPRVIYFNLEDIGIAVEGGAPKQKPFALVVGCSDARVPTELIFSRACNEIFVVRVAGNVLGQEGLGSVDYALQNLGTSLKLIVVLGHTRCGAVTAAVDAFLQPADYLALAPSHSLRSIVNGLLPAVRKAENSLTRAWGAEVEKNPGYREALIAAAVTLNAALSAAILQEEFETVETGPRVVFGVYDLDSRKVGVPHDPAHPEKSEIHLIPPPRDREGFIHLGRLVAQSEPVERILFGNNLSADAIPASQ